MTESPRVKTLDGAIRDERPRQMHICVFFRCACAAEVESSVSIVSARPINQAHLGNIARHSGGSERGRKRGREKKKQDR